MKYKEATQLKIDEMWEDIGKVENDTLRANLMHTFEKLLIFLGDEFDNQKGFLEKYLEMDAKGEPKGSGMPKAGRYGDAWNR
jgi:hypothetical protein